MKRKGIISVILCMALIFTSVMPAFALVSKFESPQYIYNVKFDDLTFVAETEASDGYFQKDLSTVFATKVEKHADLELLEGAEGADKYAKLRITPGIETDEHKLNNINYRVVMPEISVNNLMYSYDIKFDEIAVNSEEGAKDTELYGNNFKGELVDGSYKWMSAATQNLLFYAKPDGTPYIKSKTVTRDLEKEKWYTVKYVFSVNKESKTYDVYIKERDNAEAETVLLSDDAISSVNSITQVESSYLKTESTIHVDNFVFSYNEMCITKAPASKLDITKDKLQFTAFIHQGIESVQVKLGGVLVDTINCEEGDSGYYAVETSLSSVANQLYMGENILTLESENDIYTYENPIIVEKCDSSVLVENTFNNATTEENITTSTYLEETGSVGIFPKADKGDTITVKNGPAKADTTVSKGLYYTSTQARIASKAYIQLNPSQDITGGILSVEFNAYVSGSKTNLSFEPRSVADAKVKNSVTGEEFNNSKYLYFPDADAATLYVVRTGADTVYGNKTETGKWVKIRTDIDIDEKKVQYYVEDVYMGSVPYIYCTASKPNTTGTGYEDATAKGIDYVRFSWGSEAGGTPEMYIDDIKMTVYTSYPEIEELSFTNYNGSVIKSEGNVDTTAQNIILTMSGEVANADKNTVILREKGGETVEADVDVNGEKIYVKPASYLTYGKTYEIELTGDVKFGENAYGVKQKTEFTAVAETGILSPSDGEKIANTDTIEIIALTPDADKAEFYIDNNLVGDAVPNEDGIAAVNVDTKELTLGRKALKVIAYNGAEYETAYSSFYITNEVIYSPNSVVGFETDVDISKLAVNKQKGTIGTALNKDVKKFGESSLEVKSTPPASTSESNRKMLFLQASYDSYNMKTGTVVLDYWMWVKQEDKIYLEIDAFADITQIPEGYSIYSDDICSKPITAGSTNARQTIASSALIMYNGKYGNTDKTYTGDGWHHLVMKYNLDTGVLQGYCDDILCYERNDNMSGKTYYLRDAEGNIVCDEGTETPTKFNTKDLPVDKMYFIRMNYYDYHSTVGTSTEQSTALYIDNWHAYNELPIPQVDGVTYKAGETVNVDMEKAIIDKAATEIELSLTSKLEASTVTANTVKMYVNGEAATYDSVSYADQKIKIAKADGFKENDKIEIVLEDSIKFLGNKAAIGQKVSTLLYVAKNGLFIDTDIEVKGGKIYAWFDAINAEDDAKSVFVIFASYDGDKMLKCDVTSVEIADKASTVLDVNADSAKTAKIMVMSDDSNIEPLINAKEATISE